MDTQIIKAAQSLKEKTIVRRRDFHKHAEVSWTEFRTSSIVAETLLGLGYDVKVGAEIINAADMMGVPPKAEMDKQLQRALDQGADKKWTDKMAGGKTGVVGIMKFAKPGPVVALRVDLDANDLVEAAEEKHRPFKEGFASINKGATHACGHDGHTAVGLAVAEVLAGMKDQLAGTIKLVFQPAEEGVRGAKAMLNQGVVDDVKYLVGMHLGVNLKKTGQVACRTEGFLATTKVDAVFTGTPAHAGAAPETGKNAILAAATATLNLHAISRHSQGASRVNVGVIQGGSGRNVIPANAVIKVETRGATSEINEYIYDEAIRIIETSAAMQGCKVSMELMGGAAGCGCDDELVERVRKVAERQKLLPDILAAGNIGGSEDCTFLMERVQKNGGQATFVMVGTELAAGHHDGFFDFNEEALVPAIALMSGVAAELLTKG